jgi:hypothetical protein
MGVYNTREGAWVTGLNLWETSVEHRKDHMYVIVNVFCVICLKHLYHPVIYKEKFDDTKGLIRSHQLDRKYNG